MFDRSKGNWLRLCPALTIEGAEPVEPLFINTDLLSQVAAHFWDKGYMQLDPLFSSNDLTPISAALDQLKAANIPPVYIYLFDQPWQVFERLRNLIQHFLGVDYALLPNFWAWHLETVGAGGWPPHRDCDAQTVFDIGGDKLLMSLSLWVPLTDVDEENGCMYVIERGREAEIHQFENPTKEELHAVATPLAARAGSVLGWPQDVLHFGGGYGRNAKSARKSLSFEFQNTAFDPLTQPLLDTRLVPSFEARLELLNLQFDKYRHIDPNLSAY
jgi:Phytanoyl-CoA dioxygenase (PhyH)